MCVYDIHVYTCIHNTQIDRYYAAVDTAWQIIYGPQHPRVINLQQYRKTATDVYTAELLPVFVLLLLLFTVLCWNHKKRDGGVAGESFRQHMYNKAPPRRMQRQRLHSRNTVCMTSQTQGGAIFFTHEYRCMMAIGLQVGGGVFGVVLRNILRSDNVHRTKDPPLRRS